MSASVKVFEKHIQQMTGYDLVWSDKVGYVWLAISIDPVYIDTGNWIESAAGLCYECLNDIALDVFGIEPETTTTSEDRRLRVGTSAE